MCKFIDPFLPKGAGNPLTSSPDVRHYAGNPLPVPGTMPPHSRKRPDAAIFRNEL